MLIIKENKIIDFSKFETVRYRESLVGDGFPVEAIRRETGFWGATTVEEEIARFQIEKDASQLVKAIAEKMVKNEDVFDVDEWMNVYYHKNKKEG